MIYRPPILSKEKLQPSPMIFDSTVNHHHKIINSKKAVKDIKELIKMHFDKPNSSEKSKKLNPKAAEFVPSTVNKGTDSLKMPEKEEHLQGKTMLKSKDKMALKMDMKEFGKDTPAGIESVDKKLSEIILRNELKPVEISKNKNIDDDEKEEEQIVYQGKKGK